MKELNGRTILVTGGTGSFGKAMVNRLLKTDCKEIRVFSRDEEKQFHMRSTHNDKRIQYYLGDVRNEDSISTALEGSDHVFHAAALKQVPTGEFFPEEMVQTNVNGSINVTRAAIKYRVKSVVCLSTDKAVMPINALGMTKGLMEKIVQAQARHRGDVAPTFTCVRYGNVACSRGSVIPLFLKQIASQSPLTLTSPEMTRFLLRLDEAVDLVLYAMVSGESGDVFVRKSPACRLGDLAKELQIIFKSSVPTTLIGVRHGEKIHETLVTASEMIRAEDHGDYFRIALDERTLNYEAYWHKGGKGPSQDFTSDNTRMLSGKELRDYLLRLEEVAAALPAVRKAA